MDTVTDLSECVWLKQVVCQAVVGDAAAAFLGGFPVSQSEVMQVFSACMLLYFHRSRED